MYFLKLLGRAEARAGNLVCYYDVVIQTMLEYTCDMAFV